MFSFIALFIIIILALCILWWVLAVIFKKVGKVVNEDIKKFKENWEDEN